MFANGLWKTLPYGHDRHPTEAFERHIIGSKHKDAVTNKQQLMSMLRKGNIVSQITTGANNSAIEKRERNRRVIKKLIKTVYFLAKKKWAIKKNFEDVISFIRDLGDEDLKKHFIESEKTPHIFLISPLMISSK